MEDHTLQVGMHTLPPLRDGAEAGMDIGASPIIFKNAEQLHKDMTEAERTLGEVLRGNRLSGLKFRRQHPILSYVLDFYCQKFKLEIELDGVYPLSEEQKTLDSIRTEHLMENGLTVLRFNNEEVELNISQVIKKILLKIDEIQSKGE